MTDAIFFDTHPPASNNYKLHLQWARIGNIDDVQKDRPTNIQLVDSTLPVGMVE